MIRVDVGSEFISQDFDLWAYANDDFLYFSRPGKPTDNGFVEAFNSKFRVEHPNAHWFMSLAYACEKLEDWRRQHNENRPHSAIGCYVPIAMHFPGGAASSSPLPSRKTPPSSGLRLESSVKARSLSL